MVSQTIAMQPSSEYVAQVGETKYETLQAALDAAQSGDVIELLRDLDLTDSSNYTSNRIPISKSVTIDGANHTVTVANCGFGVGVGASDKIDVTFRDITIKNTSSGARCVDTRGNIGTLTLNGVTLTTDGGSGYTQPLTIGGNQSDPATVDITDSTIKTNDEATEYYAIIIWNPVNMTITDSTIMGWANLYFKNADSTCAGSYGSVVTIDRSTLTSVNRHSGQSNAFGLMKIEDDNVTVSVSNSTVNVSRDGDQPQPIVCYDNNELTGTVALGQGNVVTFKDETFVVTNSHEGCLTITGGTFSIDPSGYLAEGYKAVQNAEGLWEVQEITYVAKIGETKYETLEEAIAAAQDGETITVLADCSGNGIVVPQGKFATGLTVDFGGFTYAVDGKLVGSTGTESQAFQLLRGNKVTFKGGAITSQKAKFLVQNYSDLTLEGMALTLDNADYAYGYTLSNNNGTVVVKDTTISANTGGGFAFDVCRYASYPSVSVTVEGDSVINGEIVLDASAEAAMAAAPDTAWVGKANGLAIDAPEGYAWLGHDETTQRLGKAIDFSGIQFAGSLSLNERIDVNLYVNNLPAGTDPADYTVKYWMGDPDDESAAASQQLTEQTGNYVRMAQLAARRMSEPIHIRLYHASQAELVKESYYSVRRYCDSKIDGSSIQTLRELCQATLDYGTCAQRYFGYLEDDLANANHGESTAQTIAGTVVPEEHKVGLTANSDAFKAKVKSIAGSASLESQVMLNFYVTPAKGTSAADISVEVDGAAVTGGEVALEYGTCSRETLADGRVYVCITGIVARQLDHKFEVTVSAGGESRTISYSALSYAYSKQSSSNGELADVCKALYNYWLKAKAYKG